MVSHKGVSRRSPCMAPAAATLDASQLQLSVQANCQLASKGTDVWSKGHRATPDCKQVSAGVQKPLIGRVIPPCCPTLSVDTTKGANALYTMLGGASDTNALPSCLLLPQLPLPPELTRLLLLRCCCCDGCCCWLGASAAAAASPLLLKRSSTVYDSCTSRWDAC